MQTITNYFRTTLTIAILILAISAVNATAATFTVTNTNDSGAGSLRDAITQANTNAQADTINFDPAFFNVARTITLTSGEIAIGSDGTNPGRLVVINGPGSNLLTISGNNASRIFLLGPQFGANVTMNRMTLRNGNGVSDLSSGNGGAIFAQVAANLTLNSMVIRNNVVTAVALGGGIYLNGSAATVINDSLITENSAFGVGGIYVGNENNTFTMRNTIISNNQTPGDVGGISIFRGIVEIKNSQITGNIAGRSVGGMNVDQARMDITDTVISGNDSTGYDAGGIKMETSSTGAVNLRRVTISNNFGSGIIVRNVGVGLNIIDSTISNNTVRDYTGFGGENGGGISISGESNSPTRVINTTISGNSAPDNGGGIHNFSFGLEIINSTIVNNSVTNSNPLYGGGGIYDGELSRSGGNSFGFRFKIQNSIVAGNTAAIIDIRSGFDSSGYNIVGNTSGINASPANTGDQFNVNPNVGALANNGSATRTHALLSGSSAINAGSNALAVDHNGIPLRFDQRGPCFNRRVGGRTDIGAFEFGAVQGSGKNAGFDFDGDCRADLSVFRPSNGVWYLQQSTSGFTGYAFGANGDLITPADFDGDGRTDIAVFRPSNGTWYIQQSSAGFVGYAFGASGDVPMPADYDGDGKADIAVFRPSNGTWYLQQSTAGFAGFTFGASGDAPTAADYDGDGKADIAVFRPSNGTWYLQQSQLGFFGVAFGVTGDKPIAADYDGDGKADIAVFRPSNGYWYLRQSTNGFNGVLFGAGTDLPVPADYDGDGKTDIAVFRPSNGYWYLQQSTQGFAGILFGANGDKPAPNAFVF